MFTCWVLAGALGAVLFLYSLIDVHYFLRMFFTVIFAKFCKKPAHILDETEIYGEYILFFFKY